MKFVVDCQKIGSVLNILSKIDVSVILYLKKSGFMFYSQYGDNAAAMVTLDKSEFVTYELDNEVDCVLMSKFGTDFKDNSVIEFNFKTNQAGDILQQWHVNFGRLKAKYPVIVANSLMYYHTATGRIHRFKRMRKDLDGYFLMSKQSFSDLMTMLKKADVNDSDGVAKFIVSEDGLKVEFLGFVDYTYDLGREELMELELMDDSEKYVVNFATELLLTCMSSIATAGKNVKVYFGTDMPMIIESEDAATMVVVTPRIMAE